MPVRSKKSQDQYTSDDQLERYRLLVESIEDYAIFLLDETGHIASWNIGAEKFKGYKPQEIIGKHFSIFYAEKDKKNRKPEKELVYAVANGRVEDEDWRVRKDGSKFWANVVITALFDKNDKHIGFAKVTRDLTERKRYEDRLYEANLQLEKSYKKLQVLNAAKDEFVSLASHQLRTPATGVKQYLSLILGGYFGEINERQRDFLQKAYDSNDRQLEIVNDLLQVAQLDAGKVVLHKSPVDIDELVESVIDEQADKIKLKRQKITLDMPKDVKKIIVDRDRFRMVIENLIDNAVKYTPERGKITVCAKINENKVLIEVQDSGIGIEKKDIATLFDKFTRVSSPLTQNVSGSGLGLYWAHKIVQLHDGEIDIKSKPGIGTTFTITLPLEK